MKKLVLLLVFASLLLTGCGSDSIKFKKEYEKYNSNYEKVNIDDANPIQYATDMEIIDVLLNKRSEVVYIGSPDNNDSRIVITELLNASDNTSLEKILYFNTKDISKSAELYNHLISDVENPEIPLVLFIVDGKIVRTNKNIKQEEMFNYFTEGIHEVLKDVCDEKC